MDVINLLGKSREVLEYSLSHNAFDECIVTELRFGRKKILFTVLYCNPADKAASPEFEKFTSNFEILVKNIRLVNPYVMLFAGDFNAHSESWWSDGDSNKAWNWKILSLTLT